jgi:hypothetical protein
MVPYYEFFQTEPYINALMSLGDESDQMIRFHQMVPVLWIYSLSALLTFVVYIIYAKWLTHNRLKGKLLQNEITGTPQDIKNNDKTGMDFTTTALYIEGNPGKGNRKK